MAIFAITERQIALDKSWWILRRTQTAGWPSWRLLRFGHGKHSRCFLRTAMASALPSVLESLVIIVIFAVGLRANRRHELNLRREPASQCTSEIPLIGPNTSMRSLVPDKGPFQHKLASRLLAKFPFATEIIYWGLMYLPYQLLRAVSLSITATTASAQSHASTLLALEQNLRIAIELPLQRWLLRCHPLIMNLLSDVFLMHISITAAFLTYGYTYLPPARYDAIRRGLALTSILAVVLLSVWRSAPPRLMPAPLGFIDILHPPPGYAGDTSVWANTRLQLTLAAMPGLHVGTALVISTSVALWGRHLWLRVLAPLYPLLMAVAVLATASAWVLDCVAGLCVVAMGLYFNRVLLLLRPLEEWVFWICRTERPRDRVEDDPRKAQAV
ncbi:PAP2 superfamily-domain-containing protein [Mycena galopus ATCC 62051]|nr:PAP2 superfamily-domain-containing protein [Mycena galopus ATCC 62051]